MTTKDKLGVINICKEKGFTSHDVVAIIRRITRGKVGHTGTLDPDATGVLPICLGRATKLAEHFAAADKTYAAEIVLGVTTDTGDMSGQVLSQNDVVFNREAIESAVASFRFDVRGEYLQTPPMYSAIKIGGKKLYELARKGQVVERKPRPVVIHEIKVLEYMPQGNTFVIEVSCSKGTYVRSLAMDIGEALGCGAAMGELKRTRSGVFDIKDSVKLDDIKNAAENGKLDDFIIPIDKILTYPKAFIKPEGMKWALNGNPLPLEVVEADGAQPLKPGKKYWLVNKNDNQAIGLYRNGGGKMRPEVML